MGQAAAALFGRFADELASGAIEAKGAARVKIGRVKISVRPEINTIRQDLSPYEVGGYRGNGETEKTHMEMLAGEK